MPALFASRSIGPSSRSTVAIIASTSACLLTSAVTASPPISCAVSSTWSLDRAATATRIPASASSRAIPRPMPRPPPVTRATWPSSSRVGSTAPRIVVGRSGRPTPSSR